MGVEGIFKCNACAHEFHTRQGGGFHFLMYRCVECDRIKQVETMDQSCPPEEFIPPTKEEIGICESCGGNLRDDLNPMCPKCKSRDVEEERIDIIYD